MHAWLGIPHRNSCHLLVTWLSSMRCNHVRLHRGTDTVSRCACAVQYKRAERILLGETVVLNVKTRLTSSRRPHSPDADHAVSAALWLHSSAALTSVASPPPTNAKRKYLETSRASTCHGSVTQATCSRHPTVT